MRALIVVILAMSLGACAKQSVRPGGIYRLDMEEKSLLLVLRTSGEYVLQVDGPGRNPDEIRGHWEEGRETGAAVSFHGVVWHGTEPAAGQGTWSVSIDSDAGMCIDGEASACFTPDATG